MLRTVEGRDLDVHVGEDQRLALEIIRGDW